MHSKRIGIFGGTFDPPHLGHLILAAEARDQLLLDRLLWVLTPFPPHKRDQTITSLEHRLNMLTVTISADPRFELSRVEIDRPGPHYALDTVRLVAEKYPHAELTYLMGGDSLRDLPDWHRPRDFLAAIDALGVMRRPGEPVDLTLLEDILPGITKKVRFVEAPLLEISSRDIRRRIETGRMYRYYLPATVFAYIEDNGLYR